MATTAVAMTEAQSSPGGRWATVPGRLAGFLVTVPDRLMTWILTIAVVVSVALLTSEFRPILVLPAIVIALILTRHLVPPSPEVSRATVAGAGGALVLAMSWYMVQRGHTAQMIGLDRDPAQYTLSALYLIHHRTPDVAIDPALPALAGQIPGLLTDFLQGNSGAVNHVQGSALVPGLLALFGWAGGSSGVFGGNVAIGACGLLSVYALSRRILGPLWGLGPVLLLAVTMPLAAFSRMPYTEPIAMIFVCGMLVALWAAVESRTLWLFALAGVFAGATMIARIDGGLTIVAALAALSLLAIAPVSEARRREGRLALLVFSCGAAPAAALGWLDLFVHSPRYLAGLHAEIFPVLLLMPVILVLGIGVSLLRVVSGPVAVWMSSHRRGLAIIAGVLVVVGAIVMVSRPWWLVNHFVHNRDGLDYEGSIAARQKAEGLVVDGTRSYDEYTINWLAWYLGWVVVAAALVGALLMAVRFCRERDGRLLVVWVIPVLVALAYLTKISITPDQIWALRRLMPVVIPATAISAVFAMRAAVMALPGFRPLGVVVTLVLLLIPALNWGGLLNSREGAGQYAFVNNICSLSGDGLVVQAGPYPIMGSELPALQQLCSDKVVSVLHPTAATLAAIKAKWTGSGPITVVTFFPDAVTWTKPVDRTKPLTKVVFSRWQSLITRRPGSADLQQASAWIGTLQPSGQVAPLNTSPFPTLLPAS